MRVFYSPYSLNNKKSGGAHQATEGVLFKFEFESGTGYSLYHPISSLGDRSIKEVKKGFLSSATLDQTCSRIRESAKIVEEAFSKGSNTKPLRCYFSYGALKNKGIDKNILEQEVLSCGFKTIKFKVEDLSLIDWDLLRDSKLKVILDFNQTGNLRELEELIQSQNADLIQYLEDPPRLDDYQRVSVAADFDTLAFNPKFIIFKPTGFEKEAPSFTNEIKIYTSYLDHPLGQFISALNVQEESMKQEHGLMTHRFYEKNQYSELFKNSSEFVFDFIPSMKSLLEKEKWVKL